MAGRVCFVINPESEVVAAPSYKDRRNALMVAGILQIVMGAGAWLMALLSAVVAQAASRQGVSSASMVPGVIFYLGIGAIFVALGIGTIRARRWARSIWLVFSAGWLVFGVLGGVAMGYWMPRMFQGLAGGGGGPTAPPGVFVIILVVTFSFAAVFLFVVPLCFLLFFRSPHVKATCEALNPGPCWTDSFPLPALAAAFWMAVMGASLTAMPVIYGGWFPVFGTFVKGSAGYVLWGGLLSLCWVSTLGLLRRWRWACDAALVLVLLFSSSSIATYAATDPRELYAVMGMADVQVQMLERMGFMTPAYMVSTSVCFLLPYLVMLLWARLALGRSRGSVD